MSAPCVHGLAPSIEPLRAGAFSEPAARLVPSLETLLPALVRRVAWSGNRQAAAVRLEIGAGELEGATLLVQAEGDRVTVHLEVPPGVDAALWRARVTRRLAESNIHPEAVEVA